MVTTTNVCTQGECGGECYRCRLRATAAERDKYARLFLRLYDAGIVAGSFGPWSDYWTEEDRAMWDEIDDLKARFLIAERRGHTAPRRPPLQGDTSSVTDTQGVRDLHGDP